MRVFNLHGDPWAEPRERQGWRIKEAFVGHRRRGPTLESWEDED